MPVTSQACPELCAFGRNAVKNLFPPISFLYRREVFNAVGRYDESMAILGDWNFNIKVLLHGDIGGLPEVLSSYHVRIGSAPL